MRAVAMFVAGTAETAVIQEVGHSGCQVRMHPGGAAAVQPRVGHGHFHIMTIKPELLGISGVVGPAAADDLRGNLVVELEPRRRLNPQDGR